MGNHEAPPPPPRRKFIPLAWIGSLVAVVLLALGVGGSLSAWTASITNTTDTAGTGSLVMEEDGPGGTPVCLSNDSTATCTTINKYGGNLSMVPGQTVTTAITIRNTGTVAASTFTLAAAACTRTPPAAPIGPPIVGNLCAQMQLVITGSTAPTALFTGTPAGLNAGGTINLTQPLAGGSSEVVTFAVTLPSATDSTFEGITLSQALTWTFTS